MEFVKNREIMGFDVNAIMDIVMKIVLREKIGSRYSYRTQILMVIGIRAFVQLIFSRTSKFS